MKEGKPGTGIVDNLLGRKNNCHIFIGMSWRTIIESIGARIENEERAAMLEEVEDLTDAEHAGVYLHERLRGSLGRFVAVSLEKAQLSGTLEESGKDWFVLKGMQGSDIVALSAVKGVSGLSLAIGEKSRYSRTLNSVLRRMIGEYVIINRLSHPMSGRLCSVGVDYIVLEASEQREWAYGYSCGINKRNPTTDLYMPLWQVQTVSDGA